MGDSLVQRKNRRRDEIAKYHIEQVAKSQNEMRKAGKNCDCTVQVTWWRGKVSLKVHYAVVSSASEYCRSNSEYNLGKWTAEVDWGCWASGTELVKEALEQCIEFMYIGKADIRDDAAECITKLSHILQLKPLEDMGLETMHDNLTTCDNCSRLLVVARYCKRREYEAEAIKKWISINLQQIRELNECSQTIENLWISVADLFQKSLEFKYDCNALDVLKVIEIEKADCKFLLDIVMTNKKVNKYPAAAKYVFGTICQKIDREPSNLNCGNYYKVKNLLVRYESDDASDLKVILQKFMFNNFDVLAQQDEFLETNQDEVTSIFSSPQLTCTEKVKFDSMVKWVKYEPQRAQTFSKLFKMLKLENLSREEFIDIRKNPLVEKNRELVLSVFDALVNETKTATLQPQLLPDTARWVMNQKPECDNSSNASVRSERSTCRGSSSNTISNFSTASLGESLLSLPTTTDSGADVDGDKADCSLDDEN